MNTTLLYLTDSTLRRATARVHQVVQSGSETALILDRTIFYPQGGGQPADQGSIMSEHGAFSVTHVSYNHGEPLHKGKLSGEIAVGDEVVLEVDWRRRTQHMQWHTAGHIVDQAVKNVLPAAVAVDGNHGIGGKLEVVYTTEIPSEMVDSIQSAAHQIIAQDLPLITEMVTKAEIETRGIHVPFDLPSDKPLRILQIGEYPAMPDGGTHLQRTSECWPLTITKIVPRDGKWIVNYELERPLSAPTLLKHALREKQEQLTEVADQTHSKDTLQALRKKIDDLRSAAANDRSADRRSTYLGKKGLFNQLSQLIKDLSPADKPVAGQLLNQLKSELETLLASESESTTTAWVDLTMPGKTPPAGHVHPISQAMEEITAIFERIGFTRVRYPEVDWDYYVFESLNMPPDHPARDEWETFFVDAPSHRRMGKMVLTTQTSNGQVREMERLQSQPPIRMINIARCYRRQQDVTHTQMFHQFEGLVVDKGITIQHLKGTMDYFAQQFYGPGTKSRIRPFHFQFTEPSFEVDFSCHLCHGTGHVIVPGEGKTKCKFCKSGWHEVGGAGMVHPNVLRAGGIDPDVYTGFAFGWGIERTYTLREGLNIDDIRLLYSGDLRFLRQF